MLDFPIETREHSKSQRMEWLDYAKAIGITLVVLGHVIRGLRVETVGLRLNDYLTFDFLIYTFHMPLFFFASGIVFGSRLSLAPEKFIRALTIGLVVPYIIWSVTFVVLQQPVGSHVNNLYQVPQLLQIWRHPIGYMWFFYALIFVQIGFYFVYRIAGSAGIVVFAIACFSSYLFPQIDLSVDRIAPGAAMGGTFFALGLAVLAANRRYQINIPPSALLIGGIVFWALSAVTMLQMPNFREIAPIAAASGVMMTVAGCLMLPRARGPLAIVALIGQASIAIYVAHPILGAACRILLYRMGVTNCEMHIVSETLIGIAVPLLLYVAANRFAISSYVGFGPTRKLQYLDLAKTSKPWGKEAAHQ